MTLLKRSISFRSHVKPLRADTWLRAVLVSAAAIAVGILLLIVLFLLRESWSALQSVGVLRFVSDAGWHPLEGAFNLAPMLIATFFASVGAILLAAPLGIATAVFAHFYAPPIIASAFRRMVALLAGIPSVVFGLWGLTVLVPIITKWQPPGASLLAGILILAFMILPTVTLTADAALKTVPENYLRGANVLGLSRAGIILNVAIPAAHSGIVGGILLAAARALGETMAVLMVAGNVVQVPTSLFDPVRVLTANIALEMAYATGDHRAALFVSGLALMLLVVTLAAMAGRLGGRLHG
ncbi:phosphate ABC transporter permease subunit PstC [Methylotenera sp.]|uniref:phosphate ABC transporter permease subunit PstC n=1 Tax=Methylotenera sp. TaxID=2051956 RepID=UPI002736DE21|nr:phosphate ABC transporter permease subunit PstC [Methylotenera sp.]MDP3307084.1 phosphate ABC transporter permease subunit PstC [Methylotenera sp.]